MTDLIRRAAALTRRTGSGVTLHGSPADSTEHVQFTGERVTWADLPQPTRKAAARRSAVVGEAVTCHPTAQRAGDGRLVELAVGWRMHEDAVVLVHVLRALRPARNGLWVVGPWEHITARHLPLAGPLRRRRGVVAVALGRRPHGEDDDGASTPQPSAEQASAAAAWDHLPDSVRTTAERLVPEPRVWLGEIVQASSPVGSPLNQSIQVLRMDDARAVVVLADRSLPAGADDPAERARQLARTPWLVEQVGADLRLA